MSITFWGGERLSPRLMAHVCFIFTLITLLGAYLFFFQKGQAPNIRALSSGGYAPMITLGIATVLLSIHNLKWIRFLVVACIVIMLLLISENSFYYFTNGMYFSSFMGCSIVTLLIVTGYNVFRASLLSVRGTKHLLFLVVAMPFLAHACTALVIMVDCRFDFFEILYMITLIASLALDIFLASSSTVGIIVRILLKSILLWPFVFWSLNSLEQGIALTSLSFFLVAIVLGALSIVTTPFFLSRSKKNVPD